MTATTERSPTEAHTDASLRPRALAEYIGQDHVKASLALALGSAQARDTVIDHVLLYGPPGLGKTTLAAIIAAEMGGRLQVTSGPSLTSAADLVQLLVSLKPGDVLFIDEIHRLPRKVEEVLYPAMEDGALDVIVGSGTQSRAVRVQLPAFTLVGATTRVADITEPLRDRFGLILRLEPYDPDAIARIATRAAGVLDVRLTGEGATELAQAGRGVPRTAIRLLRWARDYALMHGGPVLQAVMLARTRAIAAGEPTTEPSPVLITGDTVTAALADLGIDDLGLDPTDRRVLYALCARFDGGPVGLGNLSAATGEEEGAIESVIEPYLIQLGMLARTPRGRLATRRAYEHMGIRLPGESEPAKMGKAS